MNDDPIYELKPGIFKLPSFTAIKVRDSYHFSIIDEEYGGMLTKNPFDPLEREYFKELQRIRKKIFLGENTNLLEMVFMDHYRDYFLEKI